MNINTARKIREKIRANNFSGATTSGLAKEFAQFNFVAMPSAYATEFDDFCSNNKKFCPVIERLDNGKFESKYASGSDLRTDIPQYSVLRHGEIKNTDSVLHLWNNDFVSFLIGCSFSFEYALEKEGFTLRHIHEKKNVPMYKTSIELNSTKRFSSLGIVSMRPFKTKDISKVEEITSPFSKMHGAPLHWKDSAAIGIADITHPDYGEYTPILDDEVEAFWACGVTAMEAIRQAKLPLAITHAPGKMFISDVPFNFFNS